MRNLLLLLVLANILYFLWGRFGTESEDPGIAIVDESELGPPLTVTANPENGGVASVGAVLGSGEPSDLKAVVGRSCVTIGPFKISQDANRAKNEYANAGMRTGVRQGKGQIFIGHSVQVQNVPDRESGRIMLRRLQEGGLGDAFIVGNEDDGISISLGIFGNATNAEKVELQAESVGFEVDISPMSREDDVYFVDIGLPPGKGAGGMIEKYGEERVALRDAAKCPP